MAVSVEYICTTCDKYIRSKRPTTRPIYLQLHRRNKIVVKNNNHLGISVVLVKLTVSCKRQKKNRNLIAMITYYKKYKTNKYDIPTDLNCIIHLRCNY